MKTLVLVVFAAIAPVAVAAPADYATQWPVRSTRADAGAYAVTLTPDVYRAVQRPDLRDLDVLDARGRPVPADLVAPSAARATQRRAAPWFTMPSPGTGAARDWHVIAEVDADGRLRGLRSGAVASTAQPTSIVVDAGVLVDSRRPAPQLVALDVHWQGGVPFDRAYRVEGSDDFDDWRVLGRGRLVDLQQGDRRLSIDRVALGGGLPLTRYVRLVPDDGDAALPAIDRVELELAQDVAATPTWITLAPRGEGRTFDFELDARFPVRWVDVEVEGNDARRWTLQSRDGDGRWIDRVDGWVAYRVGARRSPPQRFDLPVRDRHWRLVAQADGAAPRLRMGYVPERVVFVAAGASPYALVAGSATAQRTAQPVQAALDPRDTPVDASLGPAERRAGDAALRRPSDWKTWSLWAVLGLGVLIVGGFAARLLREPAPGVD